MVLLPCLTNIRQFSISRPERLQAHQRRPPLAALHLHQPSSLHGGDSLRTGVLVHPEQAKTAAGGFTQGWRKVSVLYWSASSTGSASGCPALAAVAIHPRGNGPLMKCASRLPALALPSGPAVSSLERRTSIREGNPHPRPQPHEGLDQTSDDSLGRESHEKKEIEKNIPVSLGSEGRHAGMKVLHWAAEVTVSHSP